MKNAKTKSILAIIGTLLIGFVLGFLVSGRLTHQRIKKMVENRGGKGFQNELLHAIEPTTEQEAIIKPILASFAERMDSMHTRHEAELKENFSLLEISLQPYLQAEQIIRLQKRMQRMEGRKRKGKHHHGRDHRGEKGQNSPRGN